MLASTVAPTDYGWYEFLSGQPGLQDVNFWSPSARRAFHAPEFSPFLFKLKAPHNAICGFGYFSQRHPTAPGIARIRTSCGATTSRCFDRER